MKLKQNLAYILEEKGMTVASLSRLCGVPHSTIADWLVGVSPRDLRKLKRMANVLGLSIDSLCFGSEDGMDHFLEQHLEEINAGVFEVVLRRTKTPL